MPISKLSLRPTALSFFTLGLVATALPSCGQADEKPVGLAAAQQPVADASNTDILADAPFRVQTGDTVIPVEVFVADARTRTTTLNTVKISVNKGGTWTPIYNRSLTQNLSSSADTNEMWLLHVTNAYGGSIPNGTTFTPNNLLGADATGKTVQLKVEIDADVSLRLSSTYVITLNVHVGEAPLPHNRGLFAGWYAGDTHTHTMYSNNFAEFGLPHRAMLSGARAIGLDWQITTDHSCDLDAPKAFPGGLADNIGSRTERWTFCEEKGTAKPACTVRSHVGWANGWLMADDDAKDAMTWAGLSTFFHTGEEVTAKTAGGVTVHTLAYRAGYVKADGSGATQAGITVDPISATLPSVLGGLPADAIVYGAHPTQPLPSAVGGGNWTASDIASARSYPSFKGYEFWNLRKTLQYNAVQNAYGSAGLNPAAKWTACPSTGDNECYPYFLDRDAIPFWDNLLSGAVETTNPYVFGAAGSDAHGDMNYSTYFTGSTITFDLDSTTDNALGRVRTVALSPTFTIDGVLDALAVGRTVLTDGPMLAFGIDKTGDGTLDQLADGQIGSLHKVGDMSNLDLLFKWQSTTEFGEIDRVVVVRGTKTTGTKPGSYELLTDPESLSSCKAAARMAGTCKVTLGHTGALALPPSGSTYYYRAMALSGGGKFRCLTNPIWITGTTDPGPTDAGPTDTGIATDSGVASDSGTTTTDTGVATDATVADDTGAAVDSGTTAVDSGSSTPDTAVAVEDSSTTDEDASIAEDTGSGTLTTMTESSGSCSCDLPGGRRTDTPVYVALALGAVLLRRRRSS